MALGMHPAILYPRRSRVAPLRASRPGNRDDQKPVPNHPLIVRAAARTGQIVQSEGVVQVDLNAVPVPRGTLADPVFISNDDLRRSQERVIMLAEQTALNSLIASDNGPGARNYQELR